VEEIQGDRREQRQIETYGELGEGRSNTNGIVMKDGWIRVEIWTSEPTPETVKRLIEWFSDKRN
jgi:hypothetical protein